LLEENPALRPHHLEAALEASPTLIPDPLTPRSYPRLDCADALARTAPLDVPLPALALVGLSLLLVGLPLRQLLRR